MRRFQQSRHALGSTAYLTVVFDDGVKPEPVFTDLWRHIDEFEQRFSRFLSDSELSRFNAAAGTKQQVSSEFRALLVAAKTMADATSGIYNPCILPALQRAGYKGSWPATHIAEERLNYENRAVADWRDITLGSDWARMPANTALDFGGIGKGYLLGELGEQLDAQGIANYWLSLGGDIVCNGHEANGDSWYIGVAHAKNENKIVAAVKNHGSTLTVATSGTTRRQGVGQHGQWHHLIDPRTGQPAETAVLTATVCADTATMADVAAKCLVITNGDTNAIRQLTENTLMQTLDGPDIKVTRTGTIWQ